MKKLSVIIPIYNTIKELPECLESVCLQKYDNLEIVCVDDGSFDGSQIIVDEYAEKYENMKVIHQDNKGESSARNVGLKQATGDYIAFCDCDDKIEQNMYCHMMDLAQNDDLDIVACNWTKDFGDSSQKVNNTFPICEGIFTRDELLKYIYMRDYYQGFAYMWNKIYKRQILLDDNGNIELFDENLKIGGDVIYLAKAALKARRVRYIDNHYYHYYQRASSGIHTMEVSKYKDWVFSYECVINMLEQNDINKEIIDYVKRFLAYHASNGVECAKKEKNIEAVRYFQNIMRNYAKEYYKLNKDNFDRIMRYKRLMEMSW